MGEIEHFGKIYRWKSIEEFNYLAKAVEVYTKYESSKHYNPKVDENQCDDYYDSDHTSEDDSSQSMFDECLDAWREVMRRKPLLYENIQASFLIVQMKLLEVFL